MRLHILSDLHLSRSAMPPPPAQADLVVLAGDIARPAQAIEWAQGFGRPVLYVLGNHEFYGGSIDGTLAQARRLSAGTRVTVLQQDDCVIDGVRFLGATLWSDFSLEGEARRNELARQEAARLIYDFNRIRCHEALPMPLTPDDSTQLCHADGDWLASQLRQPHPGPTVVITHHAPTRGSIHPRFAGSMLNGAFVSDLKPLVENSGARLWIHGHTHDSFDYPVGSTRVLCNPRGYAKDGVNENALFDPMLTIDIN